MAAFSQIFRPGRRSPGFTLVEILLATTILAIMTGMVLSMTTQVVRVWDNASGRLSAANEAQLALDLLAQDLEAAVFENDGLEWMQIAVDGPVGEGAWASPAAVHLVFFAPLAEDSGNVGAGAPEPDAGLSGGLSAVSYRLGYRDPFGNTAGGDYRRFALYRAVLPPESTFREALAPERRRDLRAFVWQASAGGDWGVGGMSPRAWSLDTTNLLASHVVEFSVELEYLDTLGGLQRLIVGPEGAQEVRCRGNVLVVDGNPRPLARLLGAAVRITVLSEGGAAVVRRETDAIPENDLGGDLEELITREGERFSRKVRFAFGG